MLSEDREPRTENLERGVTSNEAWRGSKANIHTIGTQILVVFVFEEPEKRLLRAGGRTTSSRTRTPRIRVGGWCREGGEGGGGGTIVHVL